MTLYVGIDIAKHIHVASLTDKFGEVIVSPFSFENNKDGFNLLLSKTKSFDQNDLIFGFESTGHYAQNLSNFLLDKGYQVGLLNPIQIVSLRKSRIRNTKNDNLDSLLISQALSLNYHRMLSPHKDMSELRTLCLTRHQLVKSRTSEKIKLVALVDRIFPELAGFFKNNLHIKTSYKLLKKSASPYKISKTRLDSLTNLLVSTSGGKYRKDDAIRLKRLAKDSVGIENSLTEFQINLSIELIEFYSNQIEEVESAMDIPMSKLDLPFMSIPGMGMKQGAIIASTIIDINRFSSPSKVLAFAGLDPRVRQSGQFNARSTRMSKRGDSLLRYALVYAAHNVVKNDETFKKYYNLKVSQGKSHYNALGHCAHKLVRVIYKLWSENLTFEKS